MRSKNFYRNHLILPLAAFVVAAVVLAQTNLDIALATLIYQMEGGRWALRDHWLFQTVLHTSARDVMLLVFVLLLMFWCWCAFTKNRCQKACRYLVVSASSAAILVSIGKHLTGLHCPWEFSMFGGQLVYSGLFVLNPAGVAAGQCFPAGHASAGYAWLGLYFVCYRLWPHKRFFALTSVLFLGLIFGLTQQLRGAHFISHDLWTLAICWFSALAAYRVIYREEFGSARSLGKLALTNGVVEPSRVENCPVSGPDLQCSGSSSLPA